MTAVKKNHVHLTKVSNQNTRAARLSTPCRQGGSKYLHTTPFPRLFVYLTIRMSMQLNNVVACAAPHPRDFTFFSFLLNLCRFSTLLKFAFTLIILRGIEERDRTTRSPRTTNAWQCLLLHCQSRAASLGGNRAAFERASPIGFNARARLAVTTRARVAHWSKIRCCFRK